MGERIGFQRKTKMRGAAVNEPCTGRIRHGKGAHQVGQIGVENCSPGGKRSFSSHTEGNGLEVQRQRV